MRKILSLGLATAMVMSTLAGCGGGNTATTTTAAPAPEATTAAPAADATTAAPVAEAGKPVEITFWAFPTMAQDAGAQAGTYERSIITAFETANPGIKVNLETIDFTSGPEKITAAIEAGTICDVLFDAPGRIIAYGKAGKLAPLDDMFTDSVVKDINNVNVVNSCKGGDTYYMYPLSSAPFTMALNKDYLEKAGAMDLINLEGDRTWTTENFEKMMEKLNAAGYNGGTVFCSGQGGDQGTRAFISNLYGSQITNPEISEYTINDANGVKAMEKVKEWVDKGWMLNGSAYNGGEDIDQFCSGNTAFTTLWGSNLANTNGEKLKNGGVTSISVPLPSENGKPALEYLVNGFCVFDSGDAARIDASKKFIEFACADKEWGPKTVVRSGAFPVLTSMGDLYPGDAEMAYNASLAQYYSPYYNTIDGYASMRPLWFSMLQAVLNGDSEPKAALDGFVEQANATIKDAQ